MIIQTTYVMVLGLIAAALTSLSYISLKYGRYLPEDRPKTSH